MSNEMSSKKAYQQGWRDSRSVRWDADMDAAENAFLNKAGAGRFRDDWIDGWTHYAADMPNRYKSA